MHRPERAMTRGIVLLGGVFALASALAGEALPHRHRAPIEIGTAAPFVQVALPPSVYAHARQPDLRDLRVVDARGERVPFALLAPPAAAPAGDDERPAVLYPLPKRPDAGAPWPSPVDVVVDGDRISVHRRTGARAALPRESAGWLIDLGQAAPGDPAPDRLRLAWSGPAEFSVGYALETSVDLRSWRHAGGGQLLALQAASGALAQPLVALPDRPGRFVRLVWLDPASAPQVTGASALVARRGAAERDPASTLTFAPVAAPADATDGDTDARRALHFDLGGAVPIADLALRFGAGTRVAPVRVQGRARLGEPWRTLGSGVFYRLERDGGVVESPPVAISAALRFLRVVADERSAALDPQATRLVVHATLPTLVFASDGQAPFALLAGSADSAAGALPVATLVPRLDEERARFGRASLGAWGEVEAAMRAAESAERTARLRPWALWAVLLLGVAALAALVWRLARSGHEGGQKP